MIQEFGQVDDNANNENENKKGKEIKEDGRNTTQKLAESVAVGSGATLATVAGAEIGLAAVGFSSIGPVAGSIAAITQASIGNIVAGSAFAIAQSAAMGSIAVLCAPAIGVGLIIGSIFFFRRKRN